MQHVLMRLWAQAQRQGKTALTVQDYEAMGGFRHILSRHADEALEQFTEQERGMTQMLFRCLCDRGPDLADVRHPMKFGRILKALSVSDGQLKAVLAPFRTVERSFIHRLSLWKSAAKQCLT